MSYAIYYESKTETFPYETTRNGHRAPAEFDTEKEAVDFCLNEIKESTAVDPRDTEPGRNNRFSLAVYDGAPIDEDGADKTPVFRTGEYYQK